VLGAASNPGGKQWSRLSLKEASRMCNAYQRGAKLAKLETVDQQIFVWSLFCNKENNYIWVDSTPELRGIAEGTLQILANEAWTTSFFPGIVGMKRRRDQKMAVENNLTWFPAPASRKFRFVCEVEA